MELIGWIGSICFSICALPQAYQSWSHKHSKGLSYATLLLWFIGEVCTLVYVASTAFNWPLVTNYIFNLACLCVIIYYKGLPCAPTSKDNNNIR